MPSETPVPCDKAAGLCAACAHCKKIPRPGHAKPFRLCALSKANPDYPRYPRLPVIECDGYAPIDA